MATIDEFITELEKVCGCSGMGYLKCLERVKELKEQVEELKELLVSNEEHSEEFEGELIDNHIDGVVKLNDQIYELKKQIEELEKQ